MADSQIQIRGFKGLNVSEDVSIVEDSQLTDATNVNLGKAGELIKRTGIIQISSGATLGANSVTVLGHYLTSSYSQLIVKAGSNLYYSNDGISYTLIGNYPDAEFGVQYAGNFYIVQSTTNIIQWNGTVASLIAGSPSGTFAIIYKERMYVLNSKATLNSRYYFSKAGDVTATGWVGSNFIDVQPGDGDFLTGMAIIQDLLVIFKGYSTWALYVQGSTSDWVQRSLNAQIGCVSRNALKVVEGFLYFSSAIGVFKTDGSEFVSISDPLRPVLVDRIVNLTTANIDYFAYWQDKLICLLAPDSSTKVYYVYHLKNGGWTKWEWSGNVVPGSFLAIKTNTPQAGIYIGDLNPSGNVFRYGDKVYADNGVLYPCAVKTKQFDLDAPTNMKRGKWVGIHTVGLATLNWSHEVSGTVVKTGSIASPVSGSLLKIAGPGYFRAWRLVLTWTSSTDFSLIGVTLQVLGKRTVIEAST